MKERLGKIMTKHTPSNYDVHKGPAYSLSGYQSRSGEEEEVNHHGGLHRLPGPILGIAVHLDLQLLEVPVGVDQEAVLANTSRI